MLELEVHLGEGLLHVLHARRKSRPPAGRNRKEENGRLDPPPRTSLNITPSSLCAAVPSHQPAARLRSFRRRFCRQVNPTYLFPPQPVGGNKPCISGDYWAYSTGRSIASLSAVATIPGDANGDGQVDINDLTIVLANYNQTGMTWSQGEFTGSGTVDINDLTIVLADYNTGVGASAARLSGVPEPSCLVLLAIGASGLVLAWRRMAKP
jgi:hypothetical protein